MAAEITHDPSTWPAGDRLWDFCRAIAQHEGATIQGSVPDRANNPGDLSKGDEHGQPVKGYENLPDGETLILFATKQGGWNALRTKFDRILKGWSKVYSPDMSLSAIGSKYAKDPKWAIGVGKIFGVDPDKPFSSYFTTYPQPDESEDK